MLTAVIGTTRTTLAYDLEGNMTSEIVGSSYTTFSYDAMNRLTTVNKDGTSESYVYSADGLRQQKTAAGSTIDYVWDGQNVLVETNTSLVVQAAYVDYPGIWGGLVSQNRSGTSNWYGFDLEGNTRILVSVGGVVTDSYSYRAFGEETATRGSTVNPYRFGGVVGYYRDSATREYLRQRHYRSDLSRFVSQDPIGFGGGDVNLYRYVKNNPTNALDPRGLDDIFKEKMEIFRVRNGLPIEPRPLFIVPPGASILNNALQAEEFAGDARFSGGFFDFIFPSENSPILGRATVEAAIYKWFYERVKGNGCWDYKSRFPKNLTRDKKNRWADKYEEGGNFNYGAVGNALGIPLETLLKAGGAVQVKDDIARKYPGTNQPLVPGPGGTYLLLSQLMGVPYGDEPKDSIDIQLGYDWYNRWKAWRSSQKGKQYGQKIFKLPKTSLIFGVENLFSGSDTTRRLWRSL